MFPCLSASEEHPVTLACGVQQCRPREEEEKREEREKRKGEREERGGEREEEGWEGRRKREMRREGAHRREVEGMR